MKEKQEQNGNSMRCRGRAMKFRVTLFDAFVFVILFLLGYGFGVFFSRTPSTSSTSGSSPSPCCSTMDEIEQQQQLHLQLHHLKQQHQKKEPPHDLFEFLTECAPPIPQPEIIPTMLTKIYNNSSPYLNFPPPHLSTVLRSGRLMGWGSTTSVFETLIRSTMPKTIIEIGTFLGASTLHMANLTRSLGLPDTVILCLDDFRGWPGFRNLPKAVSRQLADVNGDVALMQQFMRNVMDAGEDSRILPVPFSTGSGLEALCEWGVYGDLVEVDAGHDFHSAWADINRAWKVVRPGGVMFGHDYNLAKDNHGVRRAVDLFAKVTSLRVERDGQHWVIAPRKPFPAQPVSLAGRRRQP